MDVQASQFLHGLLIQSLCAERKDEGRQARFHRFGRLVEPEWRYLPRLILRVTAKGLVELEPELARVNLRAVGDLEHRLKADAQKSQCSLLGLLVGPDSADSIDVVVFERSAIVGDLDPLR